MNNIFKLKLATMTIALMTAGSAMAGSGLPLSSGLNLLVFNDFTVTSSDVQGAVAVGGNATISNYSIGSNNTPGTALTVGGNLDFSSGGINGNTVVGGNLTTNYNGSLGGSVAVGGNLDASGGVSGPANSTVTVSGNTTGYQSWYAPTLVQASGSFSQGMNFSSLQTSLTSLSANLTAQAVTGSVSDVNNELTFNAGNGMNVFNITAAQALDNMTITGLGAGTVIINVSGATVDFGSHGYAGFNNQVLFNLSDATTLGLGSVYGSILAPLATVSGGTGAVFGQVVVNNWSSGVEVENSPFTGNISAVPEPETPAMLFAGLALMGFMARRKKNH